MKSILATLTLTAALVAQTTTQDAIDRYFTGGSSNCRWFMEVTESHQLGYVMGIREGLLQLSSDTTYVLSDSTNGEVQVGLKAFCSAPENARIRTIDAYAIFVAKVKGVSESDLKDWASEARYFATHGEWPKKPEPKKSEPTKGRL